MVSESYQCPEGYCLRKVPEDYGEDSERFRQVVVEKYGLLENEDFVSRYPGVVKVAEILDDLIAIYAQKNMRFKAFDRLGVSGVDGFLTSLFNDCPMANNFYEEVGAAFSFSKLKKKPMEPNKVKKKYSNLRDGRLKSKLRKEREKLENLEDVVVS